MADHGAELPGDARADSVWDLPGDAMRGDRPTDQQDQAAAPDQPAVQDTLPDQPAARDQPAAIDKLPLDNRPADKPPLDQKIVDKPPPPPCNTKYGSVGISGYLYCSETSTTCRFFFSAGATMSCDTACAQGGGSCVAAEYDSNNGCAVSGPATCGELHGDAVCTCSR